MRTGVETTIGSLQNLNIYTRSATQSLNRVLLMKNDVFQNKSHSKRQKSIIHASAGLQNRRDREEEVRHTASKDAISYIEEGESDSSASLLLC